MKLTAQRLLPASIAGCHRSPCPIAHPAPAQLHDSQTATDGRVIRADGLWPALQQLAMEPHVRSLTLSLHVACKVMLSHLRMGQLLRLTLSRASTSASEAVAGLNELHHLFQLQNEGSSPRIGATESCCI